MTGERAERFIRNLLSALGHCAIEAPELLGIVILALVCAGTFFFVGMVVHDLLLDPHVTTAAALDSLSIDPDKWFPR